MMNTSFEQFQKIKKSILSVQQELSAIEERNENVERALTELNLAKDEAVLALSHATGLDESHLGHYMK